MGKGEKKATGYREEGVGIPILASVVILLVVCSPLSWMVVKANEARDRAANLDRYRVGVEQLNEQIRRVNALLLNDNDELEAAMALKTNVVVRAVEVVPLVAPVIKPKKLEAVLDAIYWNPNMPLAGINGGTYSVGDRIQEYEIIQIEPSRVHFKGPDGSVTVREFDEHPVVDKRKEG